MLVAIVHKKQFRILRKIEYLIVSNRYQQNLHNSCSHIINYRERILDNLIGCSSSLYSKLHQIVIKNNAFSLQKPQIYYTS